MRWSEPIVECSGPSALHASADNAVSSWLDGPAPGARSTGWLWMVRTASNPLCKAQVEPEPDIVPFRLADQSELSQDEPANFGSIGSLERDGGLGGSSSRDARSTIGRVHDCVQELSNPEHNP